MKKKRRAAPPTWSEIKKYVEGRLHEHRRMLKADCGSRRKRVGVSPGTAGDSGAEIVEAVAAWRVKVEERLDGLERRNGGR